MSFDASFWVLVSFLGFFALLTAMGAFRKIAAALDARATRIARELEEARALRDEARDLLVQLQSREKEIETRAKTILENARADAKLAIKAAQENIAGTVARRMDMAAERIRQEEAAARRAILESAADAAADAAQSAIARHLDEMAGGKLLDEAIATLDRSGAFDALAGARR